MKKPNILLFLADQHRQDCLSMYGNKDVISPNLETLAENGVVFDSHFCPYPVCTPSRYSLLTGMYPHEHLGTSNYCTLPGGFETFPRILHRAGYNTAAVGKMHFAPTYLDVGFQKLVLAEQDGPGRFEDDYHKYLKGLNLIDAIDLYDQRGEYRKNAPEEYWKTFGAMPSDLPEEHHSTTWITDRALDEINTWGKGGNLLMVGYIKPHHPFDPPGKYAEMYDKNALSILPGYTEKIPAADVSKGPYYFDYTHYNEDTLRHVMAMYYGTISHIDDSVGRIISLLREKDLYDDTMIIYTADHGDYMGHHHLILKGGFMYDPLIKIPLIIKYPGEAEPNRKGREQTLTSTIDLPAMILDQCSITVPETMKSTIRGDYAFAENFKNTKDYMVRSSTHKLLIEGSMDNVKLFDLQKDPFELNDISKEPANKDIIADMQRRLLEEFFFVKGHPNLDINAPVIRTVSADESLDMAQYMQKRSPIKP